MRKIDNYLFARTNGMEIRLIEMELSKNATRTLIIGKGSEEKDGKEKSILVKQIERTYIKDANGKIYYLGTKSTDMKAFEMAIKKNISIITQFSIGYAYRKGQIGKHIPCILGKIDNGKKKQKIFVEVQDFEGNIITDIEGKKYFVDWLSMAKIQERKLIEETWQMPLNLKKNVAVFGGMAIKIDMIKLNDYLPILGIAGPFLIEE